MSANHDWLNLIEISGPFLAVPVLRDVFPQGLEGLETAGSARLRRAYEEWRDAVEAGDVLLPALHRAWLREVFTTALEMGAELLKEGDTIPAALRVPLPEHSLTLTPDYALVDITRNDAPLLLMHVFEPDADLDATHRFDGWVTTPTERMVTLLRSTGCSLGLVTNGERWMLVHAPVDRVATFASWYARLWGQEPETLRAFVSLLGASRAFGPEAEKLPSLFERSLAYQDDVTDALGEQVRRAVEVLVQTLDRADQDRNRELLHGITERELYEAALTVMMRLVFLLAAEERGLLLSGDDLYDTNYAVSTLRVQLRAETEEILERRRSAWSRLLALFRAVFGGVAHPALSLPALGGSLFDPDRFPFLEGRTKGTSWRSRQAEPLPIDDRTVLLLLEAIQTFEGRSLSYRALDVEQIGHVYEGLLERTVKRVRDVTLELDAITKAKEPRVTLGEIESAELDGRARLVGLLAERSGRTASGIENILARGTDSTLSAKLLGACRGDSDLRDRILPYARLLRTDPWEHPLVHHRDAFVVVLGTDRRETGTHYTPKTLTEKIVEETLTPLVYRGPADGRPREEWVLKRSDELLDLKVCDPAMGSGAFLVQVCRLLSERIVEAWGGEEAQGRSIDVDGRLHEKDTSDVFESLPRDPEERAILARRLVAERCLYGVDLNPLAVELAKLSLWLTTLAKGRPFGFLDHNLKCGDSLLGIHRIDQLRTLSMQPEGARQSRLFGKALERAVDEAITLRLRLREIPIRDIHDVEAMAALDVEARAKLEISECIADAFIGIVLATDNQNAERARLDALEIEADHVAGEGNAGILRTLGRRAAHDLAKDAPNKSSRRPFHWPLEFPEVFARESGGFDAFVGNPPFSGGRLVGRRFGLAYQDYLKFVRNGVVGSPDLCAYFFLRAFTLLGRRGYFGLLATKSIAETGSRVVSLDQIIGKGGVIYRAYSRFPWPGNAAVVVSIVWVARSWTGTSLLDGKAVGKINGALEEDFQLKDPLKLKALKGQFSEGQKTMGRGFELTAEEREQILAEDPQCAEVVLPLFHGQNLNTMPELTPHRWVIYFRDWPEEKARQYAPAFRRVEKLVKPYRDSLTGQIHQDCFWKLWDLRPRLMREFETKTRVLAIAGVTKHLCVSRVSTDAVYNHEVKILFFEGFRELAVLQSTLHDVWARWRAGTLGAATLRYSTTSTLETWPMPRLSTELEEIGRLYVNLRDDIRMNDSIGLTDIYNQFHAPDNNHRRIVELRDLHRQMDLAVMRAYGWEDVELGHDFHEVPYLPENDRTRFTLSERARLEVLRRLAELNRERCAEEIAAGLHAGKSSRGTSRNTRVRRQAQATMMQGTLDFDATTPRPRASDGIEQRVLDFLRANPSWHSKSDVVSATSISDGQWSTLMSGLIARGLVERQGERRGARYRLDLLNKPGEE